MLVSMPELLLYFRGTLREYLFQSSRHVGLVTDSAPFSPISNKELYPRRELDAGEPHATHRCLRSAMSLSSMINIHWGATSFAPQPCPFCIQLFYKELEFTTNPLLSKPQNKGKGK